MEGMVGWVEVMGMEAVVEEIEDEEKEEEPEVGEEIEDGEEDKLN